MLFPGHIVYLLQFNKPPFFRGYISDADHSALRFRLINHQPPLNPFNAEIFVYAKYLLADCLY